MSTAMDTYALPGYWERRTCLAARRAFFAYQCAEIRQRAATAGGVEYIFDRELAMCNACGQNTGNWCNGCEAVGRRYVCANGMVCVGSPLCSRCEDDEDLACLECWAAA